MIALYALYRAIRTKLSTPGEVWGSRAYPDQAPATAERPYVVYSFMGGGEINAIKVQDAEIVLAITCVADSMADAMQGAARIGTLLNDQGTQDGAASPLAGETEWAIVTSTQEQTIHIIDSLDNAQQFYISGAQFRFRMERIA